jgi:hypothetical protein
MSFDLFQNSYNPNSKNSIYWDYQTYQIFNKTMFLHITGILWGYLLGEN